MADTDEIAEEAFKLIKVEYEVLPAVLDPRKALRASAPIIHAEKDRYIPIPLPNPLFLLHPSAQYVLIIL